MQRTQLKLHFNGTNAYLNPGKDAKAELYKALSKCDRVKTGNVGLGATLCHILIYVVWCG